MTDWERYLGLTLLGPLLWLQGSQRNITLTTCIIKESQSHGNRTPL